MTKQQDKQDEFMPLFEMTTCKNCGATFYTGEEKIKLEPKEEFSLVMLRTARCSLCRYDRHLKDRT